MTNAGAGSSHIFNSSVTSRRFPALRTLTAEDVEVMVMPPALSPNVAKATALSQRELSIPKTSAVASNGMDKTAKAVANTGSAAKMMLTSVALTFDDPKVCKNIPNAVETTPV